MSFKPQAFNILHDSVEDSSWATISGSDYIDSAADCDEESLDATLPVDDMDGEDEKVLVGAKGIHHNILFPTKFSATPGESPLLPMSMKDFCPAFCSSALLHSGQATQNNCSKSNLHYSCNSKPEKENARPTGIHELRRRPLPQQMDQKIALRQPAPILREILKLNPPQSLSNVNHVDSEDFKPQRCSTALTSESELQFRRHISELPEKSNMFLPPRCSSELVPSYVDLTMPMTESEFKPQRCSTELQKESSSLAFMPLRCSTDLNDSAAFNPILSSTAQQCAISDLPDLKYLKMSSDESLE